MGDFVHRTTKQYLQSVSPNDLPEPLANYIVQPDLSNVVGVPNKYWVITGDVITEMTQPEKDAVDAADLAASRLAEVEAKVDNGEDALRQVVILMVNQLNVLRAQHGLPDITLQQARDAILSNMGN